MKYREDLTGLRAVAVLSVLLFHAGFESFGGGFVGVDIFFTLSGFLITSILISDFQNATFSLSTFYKRRIQRIFPAFFFVICACIPFAYIWMLPSQLVDFAQSIVASSIFVSNMLFWIESDYFNDFSMHKPLLHTWSLSVEEQFYIFFPILLMTTISFGRKKLMWGLVIFATISFALSDYAALYYSSAGFYLLPTRIWEILGGSITAFYLSKKQVAPNTIFSVFGLGLVLFSILAFNEDSRVPGAHALLPVFGVVILIIYGGEGTVVSKILSIKPLNVIGLASYSIYLWHQPILAFARLRFFEIDSFMYLFLCVCTVTVGWLTWRYIEQPFRGKNANRGGIVSERSVFLYSGALSLFLVVLGLYGIFSSGFEGRKINEVSLVALDKKMRKNFGLHSNCEGPLNASELCKTTDSPKVLLWGDSFAMHLSDGMWASDPDISIQQFTLSACSPILGLSRFSAIRSKDWADKCIAFNDSVYSWLEGQPNITLVVLSSSFSWVGSEQSIDSKGILNNTEIESVKVAFIKTIEKIKRLDKRVVLVGPPPRPGERGGRCLTRKVLFDNSLDCKFELAQNNNLTELFSELKDTIGIYSLEQNICNKMQCHSYMSGLFIYRDDVHLSIEGSEFLGKTNGWMAAFYKASM